MNRLGGLLARRPSRLADARRFATHLTAEYNAVLSFLFDPTLDATNWRAEHALRPAVVTRKMCGGGKRSVRGAQSQQMLASILRTAHQRGLDATAVIVAALRRRGPSSSTPFNRLRYTDPLNRDKDFSFVFFVPFVAKDSVSFVARRLATKDKK